MNIKKFLELKTKYDRLSLDLKDFNDDLSFIQTKIKELEKTENRGEFILANNSKMVSKSNVDEYNALIRMEEILNGDSSKSKFEYEEMRERTTLDLPSKNIKTAISELDSNHKKIKEELIAFLHIKPEDFENKMNKFLEDIKTYLKFKKTYEELFQKCEQFMADLPLVNARIKELEKTENRGEFILANNSKMVSKSNVDEYNALIRMQEILNGDSSKSKFEYEEMRERTTLDLPSKSINQALSGLTIDYKNIVNDLSNLFKILPKDLPDKMKEMLEIDDLLSEIANPINRFESQPITQSAPEPIGWQDPEPIDWQDPEPIDWQDPEPIDWQDPEPIDWQDPEPIGPQAPEPIDWQDPEPIDWQDPEPIGPQALEPIGPQALEPIGPQALEPIGPQALDPITQPAPEPIGPQALEPIKEPRLKVVTKKTWKWIKEHKKQILIALGLAALTVTLILTINALLPTIMAAIKASEVASLSGAMVTNGQAWFGASLAEQAALHGGNTGIAAVIESITGSAAVYTPASGIWTIGGAELGTFAAGAAANAATLAAEVGTLSTTATIAGVGGLGLLGTGLLLPINRTQEYKEIKTKLKNIKNNVNDEILTEAQLQELNEVIIQIQNSKELTAMEKKNLLRKINGLKKYIDLNPEREIENEVVGQSENLSEENRVR